MSTNKYNLLLNRTFQYLGIILIVAAMGGGYWYWKQAQAGVAQKTASNQGLVGYWSFDEGTGTKAGDASGQGNTGTLTNGPTWVDGRLGKALSFDGTNDYVSMASAPAVNVNGSFAYSFWLYVSAYSNGGNGDGFGTYFLDRTVDTAPIISLKAVGGKYCFQKRYDDGTGLGCVSSTDDIITGKWEHIVLVRDYNSNFYLYRNGLSTSMADSGSKALTVPVAKFAAHQSLGGYLNGKIDEVRIYNRALEETEIKNLYQLGAAKLQKTQVADLTSGLVGYWPFNGNDISGTTAYDRSGQGNNGTLTNGPTVTEGRSGQALNFDGTDDLVSVADSSSLDITSAITVSAWIFADALPGSHEGIVYKSDSTWGLRVSGTTLNLVVPGGNHQSASSAISTKMWIYVTGTYDGSNVRLYKDGLLIATIPQTGAIGTDNSILSIGGVSPNKWRGKIDEPRVYNRALSASEIWDLYQMGNPDHVNTADLQTDPLEKGLVGYWKLDDASGTSATDSSGNANTGILTNGPTWITGQIGGATNFDGTNDYVSAANDSSLQFSGAVPITLSAWVNPAQNTAPGTFLIKGRDTDALAANYALRQNANGKKLDFYFNQTGSSSWHVWASTNDVFTSTSTWYHVVVAYTFGTAGSVVAYVNGVPIAGSWITGSGSVTADVDTQPLVFGQIASGERFSGKLDEVRIYNRVLSTEEVVKLYKQTVPDNPDTGLVGYWSFNGKDLSGTTAYDRSGKGNNGTLTNGPTVTEGKAGQALNFDGSNDYIQISDNDVFTPSGDFSVSQWVKADTLRTGSGERGWISTKGTTGIYEWAVYTYGDGANAKFRTNLWNTTDNPWVAVSGATNVVIGNWYHVMMTFDQAADRIDIYVNGSLDGTSASVSGTQEPNGSSPVRIGSRADDATYTFDGSIDEVRIYNRALSAAEITALYNAGR